MKIIRNYVITLFIFTIVDLIWLSLIASRLYSDQIGFLMTSNPNLPAALFFYLFYIAGILFFVIHPALDKGSWKYALFAGFFFGFIAYMTYDLTNLTTLKDWPVLLTVMDILWGTILTGATSVASYSIIRRFR